MEKIEKAVHLLKITYFFSSMQYINTVKMENKLNIKKIEKISAGFWQKTHWSGAWYQPSSIIYSRNGGSPWRRVAQISRPCEEAILRWLPGDSEESMPKHRRWVATPQSLKRACRPRGCGDFDRPLCSARRHRPFRYATPCAPCGAGKIAGNTVCEIWATRRWVRT